MLSILLQNALQNGQKHWQMNLNPGYVTDFDLNNFDGKPIKAIAFRNDTVGWQRIFDLSELEELTIHSPSKEHLAALAKATQLKRLHLILARVRDLDFLSELTQLEELVLTFVSGFSDLSPLAKLPNLRSLHTEFLRGVTDFGTLAGAKNLRFLSIFGSLDSKQSVANFDFLGEMQSLELLCLGEITCKAPYPMFDSVLKIKNLQEIHLDRSDFALEEYAFWEVHFPNILGTKQSLAVQLDSSDNLYLLGKGSGRVGKNSKNAEQKLADFGQKYEAIRKRVLAEKFNFKNYEYKRKTYTF